MRCTWPKTKKPRTEKSSDYLKPKRSTDFVRTNWRYAKTTGIPANGQDFGRLVMSAGFDGILYDSTKSGRRCLAIFPERLSGSATVIELAGEIPTECTRRRMDRSSWQQYL